jgi:hypothetical protein
MKILSLPLVRHLPLLLLAAPAAAQEADGPEVRTGAMELTIGGRVQTQLNTSSVADVAPSQLILRRARLELGVKINERISGQLQPEFGGGQLSLKNAYMELTTSPAVRLRAGRFTRPFGLLQLTSSKRMPVIERGVRIRGLDALDEASLLASLDYSDRDVGVQLHGSPRGAPLGLTYALGVFRGPLHGAVGRQDSYQLAGRATARVVPDVRIGAAWSMRDFAASVTDPAPELRRGHAFEIDLEYGSFAPGMHILVEAATGDLDPFSDRSFWGAQAWLGYRTPPISSLVLGIEPALRASHSEMDGDPAAPAGGSLFTPGLNVYIGPLDRIMLNYDIWRGADGSVDARSFKAMVQLAF